MTTPTNWSTNEIEKRYSPEMLKAVEYLIVRYEPKPGDYLLMKLCELLGEEGTVDVYDTVKDNADDAVSHAIHGSTYSSEWSETKNEREKITPSRPLIKEDMLFIDLEVKRLQTGNQDDRAEQVLLKPVTIGCALIVASGIGRAFGLEIADLLLGVATVVALVGGVASGQKWWDIRSNIKWRLLNLEYLKKAEDIYN